MQHYLVKYKANYAYEFDVYGLAVLTQEDKYYFDNLSEAAFPLITYIAGNYEIQFTTKTEFLSKYTWTEINKEETELITKLIGKTYGQFYYPEVDDYDLDAEENY